VTQTSDTEDEFRTKYQTLLKAIETNQSLYVPWKNPTFIFLSSTINIVKMWHSIQSVHQLMEQRSCINSGMNYTTVAMLRSDVVYIMPLDLRDHGKPNDMMLKDNATRFSSNAVTIPAFRQWPDATPVLVCIPKSFLLAPSFPC
jgi:hypothetical protein